MAALDLLGRRWALRVLWELRDGALTFRALQERCGGISPTVLSTRLGELRDAALVEPAGGEGCLLTASGRGLLAALAPLQGWADDWARRTKA